MLKFVKSVQEQVLPEFQAGTVDLPGFDFEDFTPNNLEKEGTKSLSAIHREKKLLKEKMEEDRTTSLPNSGSSICTPVVKSLKLSEDGLSENFQDGSLEDKKLHVVNAYSQILDDPFTIPLQTASYMGDTGLRSALNTVLGDIFPPDSSRHASYLDNSQLSEEPKPSVTRVQFQLRDSSSGKDKSTLNSNPPTPHYSAKDKGLESPNKDSSPQAIDRESLLNSQQRILAQVRKVRGQSTTPPTSPTANFSFPSPIKSKSPDSQIDQSRQGNHSSRTDFPFSPPISPNSSQEEQQENLGKPLRSILKKKNENVEIQQNKPAKFQMEVKPNLKEWNTVKGPNPEIIPNYCANPTQEDIIQTISSARLILNNKSNTTTTPHANGGPRVSPFTNGHHMQPAEKPQNGHHISSDQNSNGSVNKMINLETDRIQVNQSIQSVDVTQHMSKMKVEIGSDGSERICMEESSGTKDWDPTSLINQLYEVDYKARAETKKSRFVNMEGHLDHLALGVKSAAVESSWKSHYFKTKDGRLFWYQTPYADESALGEFLLAGTDVHMNKEDCILSISGGREASHLTLRCPSTLVEKWRHALLSHAASSLVDSYVQPIAQPMSHYEKIVIIELGSCSIRAGVLTAEPSLPKLFFPSIAAVETNGSITVGTAALKPEVRNHAKIVLPIKPTEPGVNRYSMDLDILKQIFLKIFKDLDVRPQDHKVLLSVPQNTCTAAVCDLMRILVKDLNVEGAFPMKQPSLTLFSYDVTTGVVVDMGNRLNIVPIVDGYVVQNAILSLPFGSQEVTEAFQRKLTENNVGLYAFQSMVEKFIVRYLMENSCYIATNYESEVEKYKINPANHPVSIKKFNPTQEMISFLSEFNVGSASFTAPEGLMVPKLWGQDRHGLHKLIFNAIQASPMDNRRALYRNIYLAGGACLLPGLAERLENELSQMVAPSIHIQVHMSPWRYHAAYLGAQVVAAGPQFDQNVVSLASLEPFLVKMQASNF